MRSDPQSRVVRFGVFEADLLTRELRKRGVRVRLQEQPFRLLQALLERPGQIVTREEIKEKLWPDDTFVDFDKSLNTAAQKLRQALGDSADSPRFMETIPRQGYRFLAPLGIDDESPVAAAASSEPQLKKALISVSVLAAILLAGLVWTWTSQPRTSEDWNGLQLRRITYDDGLAMTPTVSADGKFVAYASDRAGEGKLDIWLQQLGAGEPLRLTFGAENEFEPAFSPDGRLIAYRSEKDGGALYTIPTLGGDPRFLAPLGRRPRFSPDGGQIVYWVGTERSSTGAIYVIATNGGEPRELYAGRSPVWSADGERLLFLTGKTGVRGGRWAVGDLSAEQEPIAVSNEIFAHVSSHRFYLFFVPSVWLPDGRALFSGVAGDGLNLWSVPVSPDGETDEGARRLTFGSGREVDAFSSPSGRVVFSSSPLNLDVWSLPTETNTARVLGEPVRLTSSAATEFWPEISLDGDTLTYRSGEAAKWEQWLKQLDTGVVVPIVLAPDEVIGAAVTHDGAEVFYRTRSPDGTDRIYHSAGDLKKRTELCSNCGNLESVTPDGRTVVIRRGRSSPTGYRAVVLYDTQSGEFTELPVRDGANDARISSDREWIAYHRVMYGARRQVIIARLHIGEDGFISDEYFLTDPGSNDFRAAWWPDGQLLYYASDRDGFICIYTQPLDSETKRPNGELIEVFHNHDPRISLGAIENPGGIGLSVARDKIVFAMGERRGDIWIMEPRDAE